jgi:hypothetical protein
VRILNRTLKRRPGILWHVRTSLSWIPEEDQYGIENIVLDENIGPPRSNSPEWHHEAQRKGLAIDGQYFHKNSDSSASVTLYVGSIYSGIPKVYWFSPVITLQVARVMAHEVGHHLIATKGYVFEKNEKVIHSVQREELADRYAFNIRRRMHRHWYYRFAYWLTQDLAAWHYANGTYEFRVGHFSNAAKSWKASLSLDPARIDAAQWYLEAQRKAREQASITSDVDMSSVV